MLTDEKIQEIKGQTMAQDYSPRLNNFARAIERAAIAKYELMDAGYKEQYEYLRDGIECLLSAIEHDPDDDCAESHIYVTFLQDFAEFAKSKGIKFVAGEDQCGFAITEQSEDKRGLVEAAQQEWRPLTECGQIKAGDWISFNIGNKFICVTAKEVLNPGSAEEEIIYNRKRNHYFITSMVIDGSSNHQQVMIRSNALSPNARETAGDKNLCALKTITDSQVNAIARSFWRRIEPFKNEYGRELPEQLPVEFFAHMATALSWLEMESSHG